MIRSFELWLIYRWHRLDTTLKLSSSSSYKLYTVLSHNYAE